MPRMFVLKAYRPLAVIELSFPRSSDNVADNGVLLWSSYTVKVL